MDLEFLFLNFAGPATLVLLLLWIKSLGIFLKYPERRREWAINGLLALAPAAVVFLSVGKEFKVLSDEANLLSVANMLALFGKASNTTMWTYHYDVFHYLDLNIPTRPILFPLFVSLLHLVTGLRETNPFLMNFFFLWGINFLAIVVGKKIFPFGGAIIAILALLMSPVLSLVSTSAGFDLCSLFFGFLSCVLFYKYLEDKKFLEAFFYSLFCFASVRYESILVIPLAMVWVWRHSALSKEHWNLYLNGVLLLMPLFVQRWLTWGQFENPEGVQAFSIFHIWKYLPTFLKTFFLDGVGPYPILLHWLGLGGLIFFLKRGFTKILPLFYGFILLVLLLSHHFGLADHPTQVRLFLPLSVGLSFLGLYFLSVFWKKMDFTVLGMVFVILTVHHHRYAVHDPLTSQLTMTRETKFLREFLNEGTRGDLYVYNVPVNLTALGKGSISWEHFKQNQKQLLEKLQKKLFQRILMVEKVPYGSNPEEFSLIREGYRLTPLKELQITPEERVRISRVEWL